jgi:hypothetical protein
MMEIKVDQFVITSDRYQYILYEERKGKDKETGIEKETMKFLGFFTHIEHIFLKILERGVKESTATDLKELIEVIRNQRLFVRKASNAVIEAILQMPRSALPESNPEIGDLNELIEESQKGIKVKSYKPSEKDELEDDPDPIESNNEEPESNNEEQEPPVTKEKIAVENGLKKRRKPREPKGDGFAGIASKLKGSI